MQPNMKNQIKAVTLLVAILTICITAPRKAFSQKLQNGTVSITWVNYKKSNPQIREVFTTYTYYIKDSLVLRMENEDSTLMSRKHDSTDNVVFDLTMHRMNPVYLINLKTDKVHLFLKNKLEVDEVFDLEDFPEELFFKAKYYGTDYSSDKVDSTSSDQQDTICGLICRTASIRREKSLTSLAYNGNDAHSRSPLNNLSPKFPYPILKYCSSEDENDFIAEFTTTIYTAEIPARAASYLNLYL